MNLKVPLYLAGALGVLAVIVALSGGLRGSTLAMLESEQKLYPACVSRFESDKASAEQAFADDAELFGSSKDSWTSRLEVAAQRLEKAKASLTESEELASQGDDDLRVQIETLLQGVRDSRNFAKSEAEAIVAAVQRLVTLKKTRGKVVDEARDFAKRSSEVSLASLKQRTTQATTDWPGKKADLGSRMGELLQLQAAQATQLKVLDAEDGKSDAEIDYLRLSDSADALGLGFESLLAGERKLNLLCDQLYTSWDKVLIDMEIVEGYEISFRHLYRMNTVRITDPVEKKGVADPAVENWATVTKLDYDRLEDKLGMSIEYKAAGLYDSEAERGVPQPAGYSYIASPEQGHNQYGRWENRSGGGSFWAFYGQYHFMRSMFWGSSYQPISRGHYGEYSSRRGSGRSWYGTSSSGKPLYGSSGQYTKAKYSSSKYVKADGYKSSQYKKSGGKYRGTRYASKSSSKSSRSRSFGSSSRSSGGK